MATRRKAQTLTLTEALARFLDKTLLPDLAARAAQPAVRAALEQQYAEEKKQKKTAESFLEWQARVLEQVGAAWILSCVFVRTLEDRQLLARPRLAGTSPTGESAADSEQLFFELAPSLSARDYLLTVFKRQGQVNPQSRGKRG